jgi:hypothetical protein
MDAMIPLKHKRAREPRMELERQAGIRNNDVAEKTARALRSYLSNPRFLSLSDTHLVLDTTR